MINGRKIDLGKNFVVDVRGWDGVIPGVEQLGRLTRKT
jgi:hypothetical protein